MPVVEQIGLQRVPVGQLLYAVDDGSGEHVLGTGDVGTHMPMFGLVLVALGFTQTAFGLHCAVDEQTRSCCVVSWSSVGAVSSVQAAKKTSAKAKKVFMSSSPFTALSGGCSATSKKNSRRDID